MDKLDCLCNPEYFKGMTIWNYNYSAQYQYNIRRSHALKGDIYYFKGVWLSREVNNDWKHYWIPRRLQRVVTNTWLLMFEEIAWCERLAKYLVEQDKNHE